MKSTDLMRKDRELRRQEKKQRIISDKLASRHGSVGQCISQLHDLFFFDEEKIYNIDQSSEIFELLVELQEENTDKQLFNIINKAVRKTKVKLKQEAIEELCHLVDIDAESID